MAYLLSIGDVKSTVLPDNSTVLYTAGTYREIQNAVKRRDEFIAEGNKNAKIGYFKNGDLVTLSDSEIDKLMGGKSAPTNTLSSSENQNISPNNENEFTKGEIVYRVQVGAYKNRISTGIFRNAGKWLS